MSYWSCFLLVLHGLCSHIKFVRQIFFTMHVIRFTRLRCTRDILCQLSVVAGGRGRFQAHYIYSDL